MENSKLYSRKALWTGRIISALCILFFFLDAIMKILLVPSSVKPTAQLGWPEHSLQGLGILLLVCTILYLIKSTAFFGAILLTGYLGGAIAIMFRANMPGHPFFFPLAIGILVWVGLGLRNPGLRHLIAHPDITAQ
ncbi:MAG TPA: DoxX family protein [Chitinophagaceae bacterium]|nr:DoxX family protein [Chitinophagaceae bacterium]